MKTRVVRVSRVALTLILALPASAETASAGGWFGRRGDCAPTAYGPCARKDLTEAFQRARRLDGMDCANLAAYSESVRATMNGQIWASIRQPLVGPAGASSSAPLPSIEVPFTPPPEPPTSVVPPPPAEKPKADTEPKPIQDKDASPDAPK